MKKIVVTLKDNTNLDKYLKADIFLVGNEKYALRNSYSFNEEELKALRDYTKEHQKKLFVNVNKVFLEDELEGLEKYLDYLLELDVDGILASDFAVYILLMRKSKLNKLIFFHETMPLNSLDLKTILDLDVLGAFISKEMESDILENIKGYKGVGITVFGHLEMFYSKRELLTAYKDKMALEGLNVKNNYNLRIKEQTRDSLYPILEDGNGVNIFTSEIYVLLEELMNLKDVEYYLMDGIFVEEEMYFEYLDLLRDLLDGKKINYQGFYQKYQGRIFKGFFNKNVGLIEKEGH